MVQPLSTLIGWRYIKTKKANQFISFVSLSAMLGIALGVMVLVTVLSIMNGFDNEIHQRFFRMAPEITVRSIHENMPYNLSIENTIIAEQEVLALSPFVASQAMITHRGEVRPTLLTGIDFSKEKNVSALHQSICLGQLEHFPSFGITLGASLAQSLGITVGDFVTIMVPKATIVPTGPIPRFKRFVVAAIFSAGPGFGFEGNLAFTSLQDAQKLLQFNDNISGIKVKIKDPYKAPEVAERLARTLGLTFLVSQWTEQYGAFFDAIKLEKTMMFFILLLIIAVAAFNLVSSLVMMVHDKQSEIAILRTLGASPRFIMHVFVVQGVIVGCFGTLLGLFLGVIIASHATQIVQFLQHVLKINIFSSGVYLVDFLPSKIKCFDLLIISFASMLLSLCSTIYPARRASNMVIVEGLRHE